MFYTNFERLELTTIILIKLLFVIIRVSNIRTAGGILRNSLQLVLNSVIKIL